MIDLGPATRRVADLLASVEDGQLDSPTPCGMSLGAVIDHVGSLSLAFTAVARKEPGAPPAPPAGDLEPGWRARIARDLDALAEAWRDPAAWEGEGSPGGVPMPASMAGLVALDEVLVHGWDVAVASGQAYEVADHEVAGAIEFIESFDPPRDAGIFGPVVPVPADASPLHRLLGLAGRDPGWSPM